MAVNPIIFSGPMVRAILEGRKTMTRRMISRWPRGYSHESCGGARHKNGLWQFQAGQYNAFSTPTKCPYGVPGDHLWVRETHLRNGDNMHGNPPFQFHPDVMYADDEDYDICYPIRGEEKGGIHWRVVPSIHMPRWASRITLEVVDVRVERLQAISIEDIKAEIGEKTLVSALPAFPQPPPSGITKESHLDSIIELIGKRLFSTLWDTLNAKRGFDWDTNPWVWVVEFKVVDG